MASVRIKIEFTKNDRRWQTLPSIDPKIIIAAICISLLIHLASWLGSTFVHLPKIQSASDAVKIRSITAGEKRLLDSMQRDVAKANRIVETKLEETTKPKLPASLGAQNHATDKESRLSDRLNTNSRAEDVSPVPGSSKLSQTTDKKNLQETTAKHAVVPRVIAAPGQLTIRNEKKPKQTNYERLLPREQTDIFASQPGGYVEPLDKSVAEGDRVDMNTTNFRYLSYFTGLRKQIELVWIYPSEAVRRGLQGVVQLEMVIEKDGRVSKVRVVDSSGYSTLDENMLKTIKLASPFAPLPKNWGKERLVVTGSFHYVLSYASH